MLNSALRLVTRSLAWSVEARTGVAGAAVLAPLATLGTAADTLVVSLLGVEPEAVTPSFNPRRSGEGALRAETPVALSAVLLVAAAHADYADALAAIDHAVSGLRQRPSLEVRGVPELERLTVEIETLSLADLRPLWATAGAPHRPSVVVRVRILGAEARIPDPVPVVEAVTRSPEA